MKLAAYFHVQPGVFLSQSGQAWSNGVQSAGPHSLETRSNQAVGQ